MTVLKYNYQDFKFQLSLHSVYAKMFKIVQEKIIKIFQLYEIHAFAMSSHLVVKNAIINFFQCPNEKKAT